MPFRRSTLLALCFASLLTSLSARLSADQLYTYTGNAFDTFPTGSVCPPTCSITGSFDVLEALAPNLSAVSITPLSYSINAGGTTLTTADPGNFSLTISTDATGAISAWSWQVIGPAGTPNTRIVSQDLNGSVFDNVRVGTNPPPFVGPIIAQVNGDPGTWSSAAVSTPEPAAVLLLSGGLLTLALGSHRAARVSKQ